MKTCKLLPHTPLWERLAPPYTIMGKTIRQLFICPQSPKVASFKQRFLRYAFLELPRQAWWRTPFDDKDHELYEIFLLKQANGKIPNHSYKCHTHTHTYHGLVHKPIWTIAYHTTRYIIPLVQLVAFCVDHTLDQPCIFSSFFIWWCLEGNHEISSNNSWRHLQ